MPKDLRNLVVGRLGFVRTFEDEPGTDQPPQPEPDYGKGRLGLTAPDAADRAASRPPGPGAPQTTGAQPPQPLPPAPQPPGSQPPASPALAPENCPPQTASPQSPARSVPVQPPAVPAPAPSRRPVGPLAASPDPREMPRQAVAQHRTVDPRRDPQAVEEPDDKPRRKKRKNRPRRKKNKRKGTFRLPSMTLDRLKAYSVMTRQTQCGLVATALNRHLDRARDELSPTDRHILEDLIHQVGQLCGEAGQSPSGQSPPDAGSSAGQSAPAPRNGPGQESAQPGAAESGTAGPGWTWHDAAESAGSPLADLTRAVKQLPPPPVEMP